MKGASTSSEPGGREPAPDPLRLVQRFVNSHDLEAGRDAFATPAALARWLRDAGFEPGRLHTSDLARAVELREALRDLLRANNGHAVDRRALAVIDEGAVRAGVRLRFSPAMVALDPQGSGLDRALGQVLAAVFAAIVDGRWARLKACRREVCRWAFYDHSKNRSGTWCTMDICGNRTKTSAYWRRTHPARVRGRGRA